MDISGATLESPLAHLSSIKTDQPKIDAPILEVPRPKSVIVQNLAERIAALPSGPGTSTIRLTPHGLGLVEITIEQAQNGRLEVSMRVQNPLVLDAMMNERAALSHLFGTGANGGQAGSLAMDLFQPGADQSGRQGGNGEAKTTPTPLSEDDETVEDLPAATADVVSSDQLNILT